MTDYDCEVEKVKEKNKPFYSYKLEQKLIFS